MPCSPRAIARQRSRSTARHARSPSDSPLLAGADARAALVDYRASLAIALQLVAQDPTNTRWRTDLAGSYQKLGDAHAALGNAAHSADAFAEAKRLRDASR